MLHTKLLATGIAFIVYTVASAQQSTVDYKKLTEQINEKLKAAAEQAKKVGGHPGNVATKPVALKPDDRQLPARNNAEKNIDQ
jgi:hypothetical protein